MFLKSLNRKLAYDPERDKITYYTFSALRSAQIDVVILLVLPFNVLDIYAKNILFLV